MFSYNKIIEKNKLAQKSTANNLDNPQQFEFANQKTIIEQISF